MKISEKQFKENYEYHCNSGWVAEDKILSYPAFKKLYAELVDIQSRKGYMENKLSPLIYRREDELCRRLGY